MRFIKFGRASAIGMAAVLSVAAVAIASEVDVAVVDVTAPTNAVTLAAGGSAPITINMTVTGNQAGTATFDVNRDWVLSGGTFSGSNPQEFSVNPRAGGDPATTFSTTGTVSIAAGQADGTFTLAVGAFDITNSNATGAKLGAGDASSYSVTVETPVASDTTAPVITPTVTGTLGSNGWYTSDVTVTFNVTDDESAITSKSAHCDATNEVTEDTVGVTFTCIATSSGGTDSVEVTIKRDATGPVLTCDAASFLLNASPANVTASVTDETSGAASESVSAAADTATVGSHTASLTGYDNAGNGTDQDCAYSVVYDFAGFFRPIDNGDVLNVVRAGSAVPVKFSLGGDQGLEIMAAGSPSSRKVTCDTSAASDAVEETLTAGKSSLSYDSSTDTYNYVWKTDKSWAGTCRELTVELIDGTSHTAKFKLNK